MQERIDTLEGFFDYASLLLRGRGGLRRGRARSGSSPRAARPARRRRRCGPSLEEQLDPLLDWRKRGARGRRSAPSRRSRLAGAKDLFMTRARRRHRARGHAAALRDPGRARQGGLPAPAAPRGRGAEDGEWRGIEHSRPTRSPPDETLDFIREIVAADLRERQARDRRHALPARAERLPAHRPRQVDLPELRRRRRSSAAAATCASTTRTRPRRSRSTSTRSRRTCAGSASTGASTSTTRPTTSSSSTSGPCT